MFKIFGFKPSKKIDIQLKVFLKWRIKRGMSIVDYEKWIALFIDQSKKDDIMDVNAVDLLQFIEEVRESHHNSQFYIRRAEIALRQFKRFYSARNHIMSDIKDYNRILSMEGVNFVADIKRNKEICLKWLEDQKKPFKERLWPTRRLAEKYNISHVRVWQIIKRDMVKYAPRGTLRDGF